MYTIRLKSISQIKKILSCRNQVLVRRKYKNEEDTTPSGVLVISDTSFRPALHANRIGEVVAVPDSLYFTPKRYGGDSTESMPWRCNMELEVGDEVVHTFMELEGMFDIEVEDEPGELYRMIPYYDIYAAKRKQNIIPLNGYCLCKEVKKEVSTQLTVVQENDVDQSVGVVAYVGQPNLGYRNDLTGVERDLDGGAEINVGDTIIKRRENIHIRLEEDLHRRFFDDPAMHFIIQRKDIMGIKA